MKKLLAFLERLKATAPDPRLAADVQAVIEGVKELEARVAALEAKKSSLILPGGR